MRAQADTTTPRLLPQLISRATSTQTHLFWQEESELHIELLNLFRLGTRPFDPLDHQRPVHDVIAVGCAFLRERNTIGDEARADRRVHRVREGRTRAEQPRATVAHQAFPPYRRDPLDVGLGSAPDLEVRPAEP